MPRRSNPLPPPDRRFTHVDTGYHAGTYHRLPYYTLEYIEYINKRDNHHPSTESDFALDVPVVGFNNKRRMKPRICANESCQREFIPVGARHRSCSPRCAKIVEKKRKEGWWDSNRDAQNTRRRVETRTHVGRVATSIMLDRETDIRRKGGEA